MLSEKLDLRKLPSTTIADVVSEQGYFPVIASPDGTRCVVALRGGAGHIGLGGRLDAVHSPDGGVTWERPTTIVDSERDDRNPALGITADGVLVLAYHWQGSYDEEGKWAPQLHRADTRIVFSRDGGRSWTGDMPLGYPPLNGTSPFGKIRCDEEGTLIMPIYGGSPLPGLTGNVSVGAATTPTYLLRSTDGGHSWTDPSLVALGLNEADLLFLPDGTWLLAARSEDEAAIYTCRSVDGGRTWGDLQAVTEAREHPPDLTLLSGGAVLLTFGRRHPPFGVEGLLSSDGGQSWQARRIVLADDLPGTDTGYPSTTRLAEGRLVTVYYSAGTPECPSNAYEAVNAFCRAIAYDEDDLLGAL